VSRSAPIAPRQGAVIGAPCRRLNPDDAHVVTDRRRGHARPGGASGPGRAPSPSSAVVQPLHRGRRTGWALSVSVSGSMRVPCLSRNARCFPWRCLSIRRRWIKPWWKAHRSVPLPA